METYKKHVPEYEYETIGVENLNLTRTNLILSTEKLEETGFSVRPVEDIMEECVAQWVKS